MDIQPQFFKNQQDFRNWLEHHHQSEKELLVGFYKVGSKKPSMTWSESVDQALCFGWIDGVRKSIDEESYSIRFTPRKKDSIWSVVNIKKIDALIKSELIQPAGLEAFRHRKKEKSGVYSHEKVASPLKAEYEKQFQSNKKAWEFFERQAPSYKKLIIHWIMSAKQDKTQASRLEKTILESEKEKRVR